METHPANTPCSCARGNINGEIWDGGRNVLPGQEASLGELVAPEVRAQAQGQGLCVTTSLGLLRSSSVAAETSRVYLRGTRSGASGAGAAQPPDVGMVQPKCRDAGPDPQPGSCPFLPLRLHWVLQSSLRQVAQFIFLYLKQDFGSQGREASLRSAGWTPSCCHGITLLSKALLHRASFSVAFCRSFGADGGSARAAKTPLTSSASGGGSSGHPSVGGLMPD